MSSVRISCPNCQKQLAIPSTVAAGQKIRCPMCQGVFAAPAIATPVPREQITTAPAPRPAEQRSDAVSRSRPDRGRPTPADDDLDDRPGRGSGKSKAPLWIAVGGGGVLVLFLVLAFAWPGFLLSGRSGGAATSLLAFVPAQSSFVAGVRVDQIRKESADWQTLEDLLQKQGAPSELLGLMKDADMVVVGGTYAQPPQGALVVRTQNPVDIEKLRGAAQAGPAKNVGGKNIYPVQTPDGTAFLGLADDKTLVAGFLPENEFVALLNAGGKGPALKPDLLAQVQKVNHASVWAVAANEGPVQQTLQKINPAQLVMVPGAGDIVGPVQKAKGFAYWLELLADKSYQFNAGVTCASGGDASTVHAKLSDLWNQQGKGFLQLGQMFLGGQPAGQALAPVFKDLDKLKIEKDGTLVYASVRLSPETLQALRDQQKKMAGGLAAQASKVQSSNNLKQIVLAMHSYNDTYRRLPPSIVYDKQGKPLYSWRVLLLPYIEQNDVYRQFKLDESWDSPHNLKLSKMTIPVYASPLPGKAPDGSHTFYRVFNSSPGTKPGIAPSLVFDSDPKHGLQPMTLSNGGPQVTVYCSKTDTANIPRSFPDGTSNTIMVVEAGDAVPWSKPDKLVYSPKRPLPKLGGIFPGGFHVGLADGSVRFIDPRKVKDKTLRNAITPNDGEPLGPDW